MKSALPIEDNRPWGRLTGMLTASIVTLAALPLQLEPDAILYRAAIAGVVVGVTVKIVAGVLRRQIE